MALTDGDLRLTQFAHGGGCGCKLAPSVLQELLAEQLVLPANDRLLVGNETGDDAAVWRIDDEHCVLSTTDFFTPIVDDPYDFGRIAAANALSDIYAMGGRPIMALAILGIPVGKLAPEVVRRILRGGADVCAAAGISVAGGHSIDVPEPIYGLAVTGLCKPASVRRNAGARPGDVLILTKPLGVGVYSAALKQGALDGDGYDALIATTTLLNSVGADLGMDPDVHAMTDVTGFGLAGHALEMARASDASIRLDFSAIPLLPQAAALAQGGFVTGASLRNWQSYGEVRRPAQGLARVAASHSDRSADVRRFASRLRSFGGRRDPRADPVGGIQRGMPDRNRAGRGEQGQSRRIRIGRA